MSTATQPASMKPKRRWNQFSLRTMLVGTAVVAALVAVGLKWIAPAQRQRAAVKWIEKVGGEVHYRNVPADESRIVTKLRDWLPRDYFDGIDTVNLFRKQVTDADLVHLEGLTALSTLYLGYPQIRDDEEVRLFGLPAFGKSQLTDKGLVHLGRLTTLKNLFLQCTQLTDDGLIHLESLTALERLDLSGSQVTGAGLANLKGLTALRWLNLERTQVADAALVHLSGFPELKILHLNGTQVTGAGWRDLNKITSVEELYLGPALESDIRIRKLRALQRHRKESLRL